MSCNHNRYTRPGCIPPQPFNAIAQAVRDALADRIKELQSYTNSASESATQASVYADEAAASNESAKGFRDQTQVIANTANALVPELTETANLIHQSFQAVNQLADSVSGLMTKTFYYTALGNEKSFTIPEEYKANSVKAIYVEGVRQDPGYGFTFDRDTQVVTLAEVLPVESAGSVLTIQLGTLEAETPDILSAQLLSNTGAGMIGTESGSNVQTELNKLNALVQSQKITPWFYSVIGGESTITIPESVDAVNVQSIYIEGNRQDIGYGYTYDVSTHTITLAETLPTESAGSVITVMVSKDNPESPLDVLSQLRSLSGSGLVVTPTGESVAAVLSSILQRLTALESTN